MYVYLAHPIDQAKMKTNDLHLIGAAKLTLADTGSSFYCPGDSHTLAWHGAYTGSDLAALDSINRHALDQADALVAYLPSGVPTLGVPAEIEQALRDNKPTVILTDQKLLETSVQITNWRERGASTVHWTDAVSVSWRNRPSLVRSVLKKKPNPEQRSADSIRLQVAPQFSVQLDPAANTPSRAYQGDAGLDLAILHDELIEAGEYRMLATGVRGAVPPGYWGMITGRSSTWAKHRCDVRLAVIDSEYRGELMIGVENRSPGPMLFSAGTRLAQYVLLPAFLGSVIQRDELPAGERGEAGYGSSGA